MKFLTKLKGKTKPKTNTKQFTTGLKFKLAGLFLLGSQFVFSQQVVLEDREPEAATGIEDKQKSVAEHFMVAAANPYAANAGKQILLNGGNAIDAAIAVQAMLTLVEPQSSGIGGGAFIMYYDNATKTLHTYDGREKAPSKITENVFMQGDQALKWKEAVVGGKSVGVPGVLKALEMAHKEFGKTTWDKLFDETIKLSETGFKVSPRLARLLEIDLHPGLHKFSSSKDYFMPNGKPLAEGTLKKNPELAQTLKNIAKFGTKAFYEGELATQIANTVQTAPSNPGLLSVDDLKKYTAIKREPMCNTYREYNICGMAPPSSGGVSVFQILKSLEQFDLSKYAHNGKEFVHLFAQASALAYADRADYIADLDFMGVPAEPLVAPLYLKQRAELVGLNSQMYKAAAGNPYSDLAVASDNALELDSTSHISIVDKHGNAVSMTTSIEFMFGSGLMVGGFLLNNQLTDFSLNPRKNGKLVLNRAQANKRPRSSMSPTIVFDKNNDIKLVVGSPGGSRIINYVAQTIVNVLDFNMDIQSAIESPRITNRNDVTSLEKGTSIANLQGQLEVLNHKVRVVDLNSGLHGVQIKDGLLLGGADPRREGIAVGQ